MNKINKITIKNFTVFEDITIDFADGVNIFIGENGTGKTHLLKFMYAYLNKLSLHKVYGTKDTTELKRDRTYCDIEYAFNSDELKKITKYDVFCKSNSKPKAFFISAKDMLTHSKTITWLAREYSNTMAFDDTFVNVVHKALNPNPDKIPQIAKNITPKLENIVGGKIFIENEEFYIKRKDKKIRFSIVAEGLKKFGLLWQLLMNESITKDTVLFWDEPEANINPILIPELVDILLELSRQGVQLLISTHDYLFAKYVEVKMQESDNVAFHSLYPTDNGVKCETASKFDYLDNNSITNENVKLYEEEIKKVME